MSRNKDPLYFLLDTSITSEHVNILGSKLPTVKQVLISFLANHRKLLSQASNKNCGCPKKLLHQAATVTIREQVQPFYERSRIPTKSEKNMVGELLKINAQVNQLKKIKAHKRKDHTGIKSFKEKLHKTMVFWPKNAEEIIQSRRDSSKLEDLLFLRDQKNDRKATIGGVDKLLAKKEEKSLKRKLEETKREIKENNRKLAQVEERANLSTHESDDGSDCDTLYTEANQEERRKHRREKKTGTNLFMPPDILKDRNIVSQAIRNKMSATATASFIQTLVEACNGDTTKLNLNYTQAYR